VLLKTLLEDVRIMKPRIMKPGGMPQVCSAATARRSGVGLGAARALARSLATRRFCAPEGCRRIKRPYFFKRCLTQPFISFIGSDRAVTDMKEMKVCIGMHPYVI
jgi:hypothetical protein